MVIAALVDRRLLRLCQVHGKRKPLQAFPPMAWDDCDKEFGKLSVGEYRTMEHYCAPCLT